MLHLFIDSYQIKLSEQTEEISTRDAGLQKQAGTSLSIQTNREDTAHSRGEDQSSSGLSTDESGKETTAASGQSRLLKSRRHILQTRGATRKEVQTGSQRQLQGRQYH